MKQRKGDTINPNKRHQHIKIAMAMGWTELAYPCLSHGLYGVPPEQHPLRQTVDQTGTKCKVSPAKKLIEQLEAGHKMDALVAEAMGWDLDEVAHKEFASHRHRNTDIGMTGREEYNEKQYRARMLRLAIPRYSTEDDHALKIVDWLAKRGYSITIITYANEHLCRIFEPDDSWPPNDFVSRTFKWINEGKGKARPLAICRATLKIFVQSRDGEKKNENHSS